MADRILENYGTMDGSYADTAFENSRSTILEVILADVPFTKSADQKIWFSGDLTITFTVDNTEGQGPLDLIIIRDLLDNTKFKYIENSISAQVTDASSVVTELALGTDYTVTYTVNTPSATTDSLEIAFIAGGSAESIPIGSIVTISFRGSKVPSTP